MAKVIVKADVMKALKVFADKAETLSALALEWILHNNTHQITSLEFTAEQIAACKADPLTMQIFQQSYNSTDKITILCFIHAEKALKPIFNHCYVRDHFALAIANGRKRLQDYSNSGKVASARKIAEKAIDKKSSTQIARERKAKIKAHNDSVRQKKADQEAVLKVKL